MSIKIQEQYPFQLPHGEISEMQAEHCLSHIFSCLAPWIYEEYRHLVPFPCFSHIVSQKGNHISSMAPLWHKRDLEIEHVSKMVQESEMIAHK